MSDPARTAFARMRAQSFPTEAQIRAVSPTEIPTWNADEASSPEHASRVPAHRPPRSRVVVLGAAIAAVLAVLGGLTLQPLVTGKDAVAATPPLLSYSPITPPESAVTMLTTLAQRALAQPSPAGSGPFEYIRTRTWTLSTKANTGGEVFDARIAESYRELWVSDDGSGWYEEIRDGERTRWSGRQTYSEGRPPTVTGTDAEAIIAQLSARHPDWRGADWITFIAQTWSRQVVTPSVQAALLSLLARASDVTVEGAVDDRIGRAGVAVSAVTTENGVATHRHVLVLDPNTGSVLDAEEIALDGMGQPIAVPATVGYTVWIESGYVAAALDRP